MASEDDSDVMVVEDDSRHQPSGRRLTSSPVNRKGNICLELDGVPQDRLTRKRTPASIPHDSNNRSDDDHYRKRRTERRKGSSSEFPQKRSRPSEAHDSNKDIDVIEIEESTQKEAGFRGHEPAISNPHSKRQSLRLEEKRKQDKASGNGYNVSVVKSDRMRRDRKRGFVGKDSPSDGSTTEKPFPQGNSDPIVLDDEEERHRSASTRSRVPAFEQEEKRKSNRSDFSKLTSASEDREHAIVPVEEADEENEDEDDEIKESNKSSAVDAPYIGSTELIFEFPPGQRGKIRVTEEERGRLIQKKYLNDSLIDFYIKYHETDIERRAHELRFSAVFFSSFFFGRLRRTEPIDYQGVRGWTKNVDIFSKRFVFVPICESYHWSLIIVANLDKLETLVDSREEASQTSTDAPRIIYLDSLDPKRGTEFGETMRQYLVEEWLAKRLGSETNPATRKAASARFRKIITILRPNVPIQTNEYDCGLYVLNNFEMFLNNTDGLRDKLLSGYRDVRDAYSHVEIAILRKSIINLMNILEKQWTCEQVSTGQESAKSTQEDEKSSTVFEFEADASGVYQLGPYQNFDYNEEPGNRALSTQPRGSTHEALQDEECARHSSVEREVATEFVTVLDGNEGNERHLDIQPNTEYVKMDVENSMDADG